MIGKEKSDFSFRISWHLYAHKCSNQFVSYIQLKLLFLSIETTVLREALKKHFYPRLVDKKVFFVNSVWLVKIMCVLMVFCILEFLIMLIFLKMVMMLRLTNCAGEPGVHQECHP